MTPTADWRERREQLKKLLDDLELWEHQDAMQAAFDAGVAVLANELKEKEFPVHKKREDKILYGELEIGWAIEERAISIINETTGDESIRLDRSLDDSEQGMSAEQAKLQKHKFSSLVKVKSLKQYNDEKEGK